MSIQLQMSVFLHREWNDSLINGTVCCSVSQHTINKQGIYIITIHLAENAVFSCFRVKRLKPDLTELSSSNLCMNGTLCH